MDVIKLLFVGRLDTPKNPLMLLQVARNVIKCYPNVIFTIVGDGERYQECEEFIIDNGLKENIQLMGWQNDVKPFYKSHHIFIMTSIYEAFVLIFLEAGFNHLPTIATNVEGIPEVIINNETGLLCNPNDVTKMTENVIFLIENPDIREKLGNNAYAYVTKNFSSAEMVQKYKYLYENRKKKM